MDVTHSYVDAVVLGGIGESAMILACRAACDFYSQESLDYLNDPALANRTNVCSSNTSENTFCHEMKFFEVKGHLISKLEEPCEKETRRQLFKIDEAKSASDSYIRE